MACMVWFLLMLVKYICLFSLNSLMLGMLMLSCSFCMSVLISIYSLSWYSLMFFMVYIGGLLVLFIYMSSLKFNPVFYFSRVKGVSKLFLKLKMIFLFFFSLTQITWNFKGLFWSNMDYKKYSLNLFKEVEMLFLIKVGLVLLMVLWVMTKLSFRNRSALRPFFS